MSLFSLERDVINQENAAVWWTGSLSWRVSEKNSDRAGGRESWGSKMKKPSMMGILIEFKNQEIQEFKLYVFGCHLCKCVTLSKLAPQ